MISSKELNENLNASNSNIVYETSDFDRGIGLILFEKDGWFQLHIWNEYDYGSAIVMDLDSSDIARLSTTLEPWT